MAKREFESLWDDVRVWLSDATKSALKEAEDLTRGGRLKMDILRLSRDIEKGLARLGGAVYDRMTKQPDASVAVDDELQQLVQEIRRLESEMKSTQQDYDAEKKR
jgi:cell division protein FtsB